MKDEEKNEQAGFINYIKSLFHSENVTNDGKLIKEFQEMQELKKELKYTQILNTLLINNSKKELEEQEEMIIAKLTELAPNISPIECRIAIMVLNKRKILEISEELKITKKALENHRYRIRKKLNLDKSDNLYKTLIEIIS